MELNKKTLPRLIDISCVQTNNTMDELKGMVELAKKDKFICTFSMPCFTAWLCNEMKDQTDTLVGAPIGFPSGAQSTSSKILDVVEQKLLGCREFDMVINVGALKSGMYDVVRDDIKAVVSAADGFPVKSILEVGYLTDDEIKRAAEIAVSAGVTFVKTGTGWSGVPTTVHHIELLKETVGDDAFVKAAGGVRDLDTIVNMINAGCSRFGISLKSVKKIMEELGDRTVICNDVKVLY